MRLSGVWRRGGEVINNSSRVNISVATLLRPSVYQTTISISPLSNTLDSGQYHCQSAITSNPFVLYADASQQVAIRIEGIQRRENFSIVL